MSEQIGDVDALLKVQELILNRIPFGDAKCIDDIILLLRVWQDEEVEEKPTGQMWEIEVPVTYIRTYYVPGKDAEAALDFFHEEEGNIDRFTAYDDIMDEEITNKADVQGRAPNWVIYDDGSDNF